MSYPINVSIPATGHTPAQDYNGMRTNYAHIDSYLSVDHVDPGESGNGTHKQVTLHTSATPAVQSGTTSVVYSKAGVTTSPTVQLFYNNSQVDTISPVNDPFPLSIIKAFARFNGTTGGIIGGCATNISSIVRNSTGNYTVTLKNNVVTSSNYMVLAMTGVKVVGPISVPLDIGYSITSATQFNLYTIFYSSVPNVEEVSDVSFIVLQI